MSPTNNTNSYRQPAHKIVGILSGEWVIAVLSSLATQPRRSMELLEEINRNEERLDWTSHERPLTRKVFIDTLKTLERDGLITKTKRTTQFGAVWYNLTPMGHDFLRTTAHLAKLGLQYNTQIDQARAQYDKQEQQGKRVPNTTRTHHITTRSPAMQNDVTQDPLPRPN
jgi:DNA-binding HxlR family transcriptional regulator